MKVLIVEDEKVASERLQMLLKTYDNSIEILPPVESVEEAKSWLSSNPHPDIMLLDIQLSDGYSFEVFNYINYTNPVIFTTAYHEYALDAFKYFSVDYLLKPVTYGSLQTALDKLKSILHQEKKNYKEVFKTQPHINSAQYKERFLIRIGQRFIFVKVTDVCLFKSEESLVYLTDKNNNKFLIDYTLEKLETALDPKLFFRINRKVIANINNIVQVKTYSNKRLQIILENNYTSPDLVVSRERVNDFRRWAGQ